MKHPRLRYFIPLILLLPFVVLMGGCSYLGWSDTKVDYSDSYDFKSIHNMAFLPRRSSPESSSGLSDEQNEGINLAVTRALTGRGINIVEDMEQADVVILWQLVLDDRTDARTYDSNANYRCWRCGPAVTRLFMNHYTGGTFIVDIIDRKISQSVWRGVTHGRLAADDEGHNAQERADAVAREVFQEFPPN